MNDVKFINNIINNKIIKTDAEKNKKLIDMKLGSNNVKETWGPIRMPEKNKKFV